MSQLTFLAADRPLVKSYTIVNGILSKESYPKTYEFTSHTEEVDSLQRFLDSVRAAADRGWCLLKGNVERPLVSESRAGSTNANTPTWWLCLDFDRLPMGMTIEDALAVLGLANVSYVVQYSASSGIEPSRGITAHVFILMTLPVAPALLKQWLIGMNLNCFSEQITLTKSYNALSWPLDVSTCQNDKLIYVAPPLLGAGVVSTFEGERILMVAKTYGMLDPFTLPQFTPAQNRVAIEAKLNALRAVAGLPARKWTYKLDKTSGLEVLNKPDEAVLTGIKQERGYTYFNLNGGDSWGYYHQDDSPEVIRNFKGEQNYLTAELLPEYWAQLQSAKPAQDAGQTTRGEELVLVFRDPRTAVYYNGTYRSSTGELFLARANGVKQLQDFLVCHGRTKLDVIPDWTVTYDPQSTIRVDTDNRTVNTFTPSKYMAGHAGRPAVPVSSVDRTGWPITARILNHLCGDSAEVVEHTLNWTACLFQYRRALTTAWAYHGVEGTGKGLFVNKVLIPLLGASNVVIKRMEQLEDTFNGYAESALLVVVDEAQISDSRKSKMVMANLKNMITEPTIEVRRMRTEAYSVPNWTNWVFLSNMADPVTISRADRRFNVGNFQGNKLEITTEEVDAIEGELEAFANYLHSRTADLDLARTILQTEERMNMIEASTLAIDTAAQAIREGNLEYFWDALPSGDAGFLKPEVQALHDAYVRILHTALSTSNEVHRVTRDELRAMLAYAVGDMPQSHAKFTRMMRLHRLPIVVLRINGAPTRGVEINWRPDAEWRAERLAALEVRKPTLKVVGGTTIANKEIPDATVSGTNG